MMSEIVMSDNLYVLSFSFVFFVSASKLKIVTFSVTKIICVYCDVVNVCLLSIIFLIIMGIILYDFLSICVGYDMYRSVSLFVVIVSVCDVSFWKIFFCVNCVFEFLYVFSLIVVIIMFINCLYVSMKNVVVNCVLLYCFLYMFFCVSVK